jgi:hypothetical protein
MRSVRGRGHQLLRRVGLAVGLMEVSGGMPRFINIFKCFDIDFAISGQRDVKRVCSQLKSDKSLNRGGRFEWIDSILVRCLRDGHWLLIDNVNFCR